MNAMIDMNKFTFCGKTINALSELLMEELLQAPAIDNFHTIYPDIVVDTEIGFVGEGGLVGVANQGCDPEPQKWNIATRKLKWTPIDWEVLLWACWKDLKNTAAAYSLRTGTAIADFSETDYMMIVKDVLSTAMLKFVYRLAWFNDTDAKPHTQGGVLTEFDPVTGEHVDVSYFNMLDGLWKQILYQTTINASQLIPIAENAQATFANQRVTPAAAYAYIQKLITQAPLLLRSNSNGIILTTQFFYDQLMLFFTMNNGAGTNIESLYKNTVDGIPALFILGVPIIPVPIWDEIIQSYENTGVKWNMPNRLLYTTKQVIGLGVDAIDSFSNVDVWYDRDSRRVKMEAMGIADAKLTNPSMLITAL